MVRKKAELRAIDLYSGVGGWALGLRLAGINVVASYERWGLANETNFKNNHHQAQTVDIRRLELSELPENIDVVVGSPPCTQFSYSNRGGNGDIKDGLQDIIKFLTIVDHIKPKFWAMENVPRVAKILEKELQAGGCLERFRHLDIHPHVVNMEDYGLPQRRRRCIAGNFDFDLLSAYRAKMPKMILGDVVRALSVSPLRDPIYGIEVGKDDLRDHVVEDFLSDEEVRINRTAKMTHPVYNSMVFPDPLNKSVRTITATCTRVSRESIVIESPELSGKYRRLTIRERACLQGFPITFQFYEGSYSQRLRMVGNALPPVMSYYVAQAIKGTSASNLVRVSGLGERIEAPVPLASNAKPDKPSKKYPPDRRFRFAIPSLRLKSGVRFELVNSSGIDHPGWAVAFYFGTSKSIEELDLNNYLKGAILKQLPKALDAKVKEILSELTKFIQAADITNMQRIWNHSGLSGTTPFMLLDQLDRSGNQLLKVLEHHDDLARKVIKMAVGAQYGEWADSIPGVAKLTRNAPLIMAGLLIGAVANQEIALRWRRKIARKRLLA